jgi:hypothetical protein
MAAVARREKSGRQLVENVLHGKGSEEDAEQARDDVGRGPAEDGIEHRAAAGAFHHDRARRLAIARGGQRWHQPSVNLSASYPCRFMVGIRARA